MPIRVSLFGSVPFVSRWGISVAAKEGKEAKASFCQLAICQQGGRWRVKRDSLSVGSHCQGQRLCLKAFLMNAIEAARLAF